MENEKEMMLQILKNQNIMMEAFLRTNAADSLSTDWLIEIQNEIYNTKKILKAKE